MPVTPHLSQTSLGISVSLSGPAMAYSLPLTPGGYPLSIGLLLRFPSGVGHLTARGATPDGPELLERVDSMAAIAADPQTLGVEVDVRRLADPFARILRRIAPERLSG